MRVEARHGGSRCAGQSYRQWERWGNVLRSLAPFPLQGTLPPLLCVLWLRRKSLQGSPEDTLRLGFLPPEL